MKMYIGRLIEKELSILKNEYPVITITGPRQSGKTTLARKFFRDYKYFSLESPDIRSLIASDPRSFLEQNPERVILDEIQRLPLLLSFLQEYIDLGQVKNYVLTGSAALNMLQSITQTLTGRTAVVKLMPFSLIEISNHVGGMTTDQLLLTGSFPATFLKKVRPQRFFADYIETYLQHDIRQIINIKHLREFEIFLQLLAGRIAKEYNASTLSSDVGVSVHTIKAWTNALEALYAVFFLPSFHTKIRQQLIKSPKFYFTDTGIVCFLLKIQNTDQLWLYPLRGEIFENYVVSEIRKQLIHKNSSAQLFYYKEVKGLEIDLLIMENNSLKAIEIKSAKTFNKSFLKNLSRLDSRFADRGFKQINKYVLYDGQQEMEIQGIRIMNFKTFLMQEL